MIVVAILAGVAGLAWTQRDALSSAIGLTRDAGPGRAIGRDRRVPVIVTSATAAEDRVSVEVVGTGRARRSIVLRAEAEGKVVEMPVATDRQFKQGDVLLRLADKDARLAVALAEARLAEAGRVRARFQRLKAGGNAAAARLDEARTAATLAGIELQQAKQTLQKRTILAPFDGVAGLTDVEPGAWIDSAVAIGRFDDRSAILIEIDLPEALLPRLRPGMAVRATTFSAPGRAFDGLIAAIDSRVEAASRSVRVQVELPNRDDALRPGASFAVRLDLPGGRFARVPDLAVQFSRNALHVWRVRDGMAERVNVRLVRRLDGAALIDGDIAEGDQIVIEGTQRLRPGRPVRIVETAAGSAS